VVDAAFVRGSAVDVAKEKRRALRQIRHLEKDLQQLAELWMMPKLSWRPLRDMAEVIESQASALYDALHVIVQAQAIEDLVRIEVERQLT
jgi:hypothetical protein